jgi:hypothetical protein
VGGQRRAPAALTPRNTRYPLYRRWVGPRAGLDRCGKSRPHRDSVTGPSSLKPVAVPTELSWPTDLAMYTFFVWILVLAGFRKLWTVVTSDITSTDSSFCLSCTWLVRGHLSTRARRMSAVDQEAWERIEKPLKQNRSRHSRG